MVVRFVKERDTKNCVRYSEVVADGDTAKIGTLYLQKAAVVANELGDNLEVTIKSVK
jgi:hypothetical protein